MPIKNIIFDLGGVIIDLDYNLTSKAFNQLGVHDFNEVYSQSKQDHLFDDFDIGKISSDEFRCILKKKLGIEVNDEKFDIAWNAMLLDIPKQRLDFIKELGKNYNVFLLSNTNDIHLKEVFNICQRQNGFSTFEGYFSKEYYSNQLGMRKPNPEAFNAILAENKIEARETLFIDDTLPHVLGARRVGLHAIHLTPEKSIFEVVKFIEEINKISQSEESDLTHRFQAK